MDYNHPRYNYIARNLIREVGLYEKQVRWDWCLNFAKT